MFVSVFPSVSFGSAGSAAAALIVFLALSALSFAAIRQKRQ